MILDTNALSAFADQQMSVLKALTPASELAIPVVVVGEYRFGIALSRRRDWYEKWLAEFLKDCRVLNIDESTARHYADIRVHLKVTGTPIPVNDVWIAALCRQHNLAVLSRDRHFDSVPRIQRVPW